MKKGMRIAAAVMAAAFSMTVLAGCGKSETKTAETTAAAAASAENSSAAETAAASDEKKDLREVNVVLDWYPNAIHTFIYTAIERGEESVFEPVHDADGNQTLIRTSTGIWQVAYNAENRPVRFVNESAKTVVECTYDYMGRRHTRKVSVNGTERTNSVSTRTYPS